MKLFITVTFRCFLICSITLLSNCTAQQIKTGKSFVVYLNDISVDWKNDSIGKNGYRQSHAHLLLRKKISMISKDSVLSKLGKPNTIWEQNNEIAFQYYTFNAVRPSGEIYYESIIFYFDTKTSLLIRTGYTDNETS